LADQGNGGADAPELTSVYSVHPAGCAGIAGTRGTEDVSEITQFRERSAVEPVPTMRPWIAPRGGVDLIRPGKARIFSNGRRVILFVVATFRRRQRSRSAVVSAVLSQLRRDRRVKGAQ